METQMRKIDLIRARALAATLENIEYLDRVADELSSSRKPETTIVINGCIIDIDTSELRAFVNAQINSKAIDIELQFGLDAR